MQQRSRRLCTAQPLIARFVLVITLLLAGAAINSTAAQTCMLQGTVSVSSNNGPTDRLPGASLNLTPAEPGKTALATVTND